MSLYNLLEKYDKEQVLNILDNYSRTPVMPGTSIERLELLKKARNLIAEGKSNNLQEIDKIDKRLEELKIEDAWD